MVSPILNFDYLEDKFYEDSLQLDLNVNDILILDNHSIKEYFEAFQSVQPSQKGGENPITVPGKEYTETQVVNRKFLFQKTFIFVDRTNDELWHCYVDSNKNYGIKKFYYGTNFGRFLYSLYSTQSWRISLDDTEYIHSEETNIDVNRMVSIISNAFNQSNPEKLDTSQHFFMKCYGSIGYLIYVMNNDSNDI